MDWGDVVVRSRGLSTHLLARSDFERLAASSDTGHLTRALASYGDYRGVGSVEDVDAFESGVRNVAGRRMQLLARWAGGRQRLLSVIFEDEDRRSVRQLLRGAAQGAASGARLAGVVPTPGLSAGMLHELARQSTARAVAGMLAAWGTPWSEGLLPWVAGPLPDLQRVDVALARTFARRAVEAARRAERTLRHHVACVIDVENAWNALSLGASDVDEAPDQWFIEGGERLPRSVFADAIVHPEGARGRLTDRFRGTAAGDSLETSPDRWETTWLRARVRELSRIAAVEPLGLAPVIRYALLVRAEAMTVGAIMWGVALGAPSHLILQGSVR